jgi:hypothetical protein
MSLHMKWSWSIIILVIAGIILCAGCSPKNSETAANATQEFNDALLTATFAVTIPPTSTHSPLPPTSTPTPTITPTYTRTPYSGTPPSLPEIFQSGILRPNTQPQTYIEDTCAYLKDRWNPNNSTPGTVVMTVMYHSVTSDDTALSDHADVHDKDMKAFLEYAYSLGFSTVTTRQLVNFLEHNAKIPDRSLMLIVDDRRPGVVRQHFMPYLEKYDWTLTLAWIIGDTDSRPASYLTCCPNENYSSLWEQMEAYNSTGRLDVQAHGYVHNINISEYSSDEFILHEIFDSRAVLQEHFYCKNTITGQVDPNCSTQQPLAFIWPGGNFTAHAAQIARQSGYHIGFTINPRGPVMFNWIPLAEEKDPMSPSWLPEIPVGDPLMTLPRYWSYDAISHIDDVVQIGEQAALQAAQDREQELLYYDMMCKATLGEIPTATP